jgi:hypothetical protein
VALLILGAHDAVVGVVVEQPERHLVHTITEEPGSAIITASQNDS